MEHGKPVDWKILATDDVQGLNIRCHELQTGECLQDIITYYKENYTMALIIINNDDKYAIEESFFEGLVEVELPVIYLTSDNGAKLLNILSAEEDNVLAQIEVENAVDVIHIQATSPPAEDNEEPGQFCVVSPTSCMHAACSCAAKVKHTF